MREEAYPVVRDDTEIVPGEDALLQPRLVRGDDRCAVVARRAHGGHRQAARDVCNARGLRPAHMVAGAAV